jgi:glycosyltransferase involved in cell wall biosynthesis
VRIAFIHSGPLDTITGGNLYDRALISALKHIGHSVHVWSTDDYQLEELVRRIIQNNIGHVVQDSLAYKECLPLNTALKRACPTVELIALIHNFHSELHPEKNSLHLEHQYLAAVDKSLCVSQTIHHRIQQLALIKKPTLILNPGRSDMPCSAAATPARKKVTQLNLICVAHWLPNKRPVELLQALANSKTMDWHLTLVGSMTLDTQYAQKVYRTLETCHLADRVTCLGELCPDQLADIYRQQDILLQSSVYESFGLVILEAYQWGLPIISFAAGEPKHIIQQARTGFWLPNFNTLANTLHSISNPTTLTYLSQQCRQQSMLWPSWQEQALRFANFMRE